MRLLTHNFLQCVNCCSLGYPLALQVSSQDEVEYVECDFDEAFIQNLLNRLDFKALRAAIEGLPIHMELPVSIPESCESEVLSSPEMEAVHKALNCYEILNGTMTCPECSQVYDINDRIPNMVVPSKE